MTNRNDTAAAAAVTDVTMVQDAIHNPAEPRHFMRVVPAASRRTATVGDVTLADSDDAVIVKEVGRDIYDPVVYFPRADVRVDALTALEKTTHCPLKGDTEYFDVVLDSERVDAAAWSYTSTIDVAEVLQDLIAFDSRKVTVT